MVDRCGLQQQSHPMEPLRLHSLVWAAAYSILAMARAQYSNGGSKICELPISFPPSATTVYRKCTYRITGSCTFDGTHNVFCMCLNNHRMEVVRMTRPTLHMVPANRIVLSTPLTRLDVLHVLRVVLDALDNISIKHCRSSL